MNVYNVLAAAGVAGFKLWDEKNTPFLVRFKDGELTGDLYFYLVTPDDINKPNMARIRDEQLIEYYEIYTNANNFRSSDFEAFGLNKDDYNLLVYFVHRDMPTKEKIELYWQEKNSEWLTRIDKEGHLQYYKYVYASDEDPLFKDIFDTYKVSELIAYYDSDKNYTGNCTATITHDLECYKQLKDKYNIEY